MSSIWFTSDTHYHHKNIVRGTSEWENTDRCRKFGTLEEHDDTLIQNINKVCKPQDVIYHNGDWSFGGVDKVSEFFNRLNCHNIHLILGNHDHHIAKKDTFEHNLFLSVNDIGIINIKGQKIINCHLSMRTWYKASEGSWMFYGHSHGSLPPYGKKLRGNKEKDLFKTMDVGIDTHPEFRPYHLDELRGIMNKRSNLVLDHHK